MCMRVAIDVAQADCRAWTFTVSSSVSDVTLQYGIDSLHDRQDNRHNPTIQFMVELPSRYTRSVKYHGAKALLYATLIQMLIVQCH